MTPRFFRSATDFRKWLAANHVTASEVWVGFYKKGASKRGISYSDAVDQALCFGWIDGVRKGVEEDAYAIRFTPRKPGSIWSAVNIAKVDKLQKEGLMEPSGLAAFERRDPKRSKIYSYEQREASFDDDQLRRFRKNKAAWAFFERQPPSYRKGATWWVTSAKRDETKERRLTQLIADSAAGRRVARFVWPGKSR